MTYNFDTILNRKNTGSMKWDFQKEHMGYESKYPLWVADTDFEICPEISAHIAKIAISNKTFGYTERMESYLTSVSNWFTKRYNWSIEKEWIETTSGIILTIGYLIDILSNQGDEIIIQPPVYNNFKSVVEYHKRECVENDLIMQNGDYQMDFEGLEKLINKRTKILIVCNPHNPIGKSWDKETLTTLANICRKHQIFIISDEIHSDISFERYNSMGVCTDYDKIAVCTSCGKGFNISGMKTANIIIPCAKTKSELFRVHKIHGLDNYNPLSLEACRAAYEHGEDWLDSNVNYIKKNHLFLHKYLLDNLPQLKPYHSNAGFLAWIDCKLLGLNDAALKQLFRNAGISLSVGSKYGTNWSGYVRLNIGCSKIYLKEALDALKEQFMKEGYL